MTGILFFAIGIIFGISILTYSSSDYAFIQGQGIRSLLDFGQNFHSNIENRLGPLGAVLSHLLVYRLFGYHSIFLAIIIVVYGWGLFRHHDLSPYHLKAFYAVLFMILASSVAGWVTNEFGLFPEHWGGSSGMAMALLLRALTGPVGPVIILGSLLLIVLILLLNKDIQSIERKIKRVIRWLLYPFILVKEKLYGKSSLSPDNNGREKEDESIDTDTSSSDKTTEYPRATKFREDEKRKRWEALLQSSKEKEKQRAQKDSMGSTEDQHTSKTPDTDARTTPSDSEKEPEITVYKGDPEEEAGNRTFEKEQKKKLEKTEIKYTFPTLDLLDKEPETDSGVNFEEINRNKMIILDKLNRHGIDITAIEAIVGPTVTLYELEPAPDVKISKIESYANDLKMAMATRGLRIISPIPGKSAVGIEVPKQKRETVFIRSLINTRKFAETQMALPVAFGRTIENEVFMVDLSRLPHLLMAGATGSGKTVGINTIITCLLYKCHPKNLKFVMIDPKKIELSLFRNIQHHFLAKIPNASEPIITDTAEVLLTLKSVCKEMDNRYDLLKMASVRDISSYNKRYKTGALEEELGHRHLPYIVVVIDELADLMLTAGKQIEEPIARLAQLARAVGIHLVVATQRPSVNVITGTIKANFPARIAYRVASKIDSRTILDTMGADQLVGQGDMLYNSGGVSMIRLQNAFVSTEEIERINAFIGNQTGYDEPYYLPETEEQNGVSDGLDQSERDDLFEDAAKLMLLHRQGSVSLLQRKLKLGYNRAGRLIDQLFAAGIVGPYQGSTAREVLIETEEELQQILNELDD